MPQAARSVPVFNADLLSIEAEVRGFMDDIKAADVTAGQAVIEVGRRLAFVKANHTKHGEWIPWLDRMGIEKRTAQRYIASYEQFGNTTCASLLTSGLMFDLLALPASVSRETFLRTPQTIPSTGETKLITEMSQKERRDVVKAVREATGLGRKKPGPEASANPAQKPESTGPPDPLKAFDSEVLDRLPVSIARRVVDLDRETALKMLDVAAQISSIGFSESFPEILDSVKAGESTAAIVKRYKVPHKRQSMYGIDIDPSELFDVDEGDNEGEVKKRYRKWSKIFHPDNPEGGSEIIFKIVVAAWQEYQRDYI